MKRARDAGVDKVNALVTVSEEYNRRNQNMTIEENLEEIGEIVSIADDADIAVEAGIGMSFFNPYQGRTPQEKTLSVVESVLDHGVDEVTLATSMGMANPRQMRSMLAAVYDRWPDVDLGLHLHDTNGMSLANTLVAMQMGVQRFDSSVCGLGGGVILPKDLEGIGNTPTEDLVNMLRGMNVETGIDFDRLSAAAEDVRERFDLPATSHVLKGGTRENVLSTVGDD
jgi:hydroxymethylglutaryl-CoA lyase